MSEVSVVAVYGSMVQAEEAVHKLDEGDFSIKQVSIVTQNLESQREVHGFVTAGDVAASGAATGAWAGGLFGLLVGAAFIWVPGFGPLLVAGPAAAALLGTIEGIVAGGAAGGMLGALVGWGVSREHILKYEDTLKGGDYLVIAHGKPGEVAKAKEILEGTDARELTVHEGVD